jgi:hypothetical protein
MPTSQVKIGQEAAVRQLPQLGTENEYLDEQVRHDILLIIMNSRAIEDEESVNDFNVNVLETVCTVGRRGLKCAPVRWVYISSYHEKRPLDVLFLPSIGRNVELVDYYMARHIQNFRNTAAQAYIALVKRNDVPVTLFFEFIAGGFQRHSIPIIAEKIGHEQVCIRVLGCCKSS